MGQQVPKQPNQPQISIKDQVKQYTKDINKMRREYGREKYKLEYQGKTLQRQLKKKIDKNESAVMTSIIPQQSKKITAQQILKNNQMIQKYNNLDNQFQNISFELQQMAVNESMQNVMAGMAKIMSGANSKMKGKDYEQTMKKFMNEKERMNILGEMVQDSMNNDQAEIEDDDVDKLISEMTEQSVQKKKQKMENMDLDDYENQVQDL